MTAGERLLLTFCRKPEEPDYQGGTARTNLDNALSFLTGTVPDFLSLVEGKEVLDFGCGRGFQSAALARRGVPRVVGLDLPRPILRDSWRQLLQEVNRTNLIFTTKIPKGQLFDVVISCSSFEHFEDPAAILQLLRAHAKPGGKVIISFAEPWFSPHGSHMDGFTWLPWVNILFRERTVMKVRARFRDDGATRYEQVEGGLNRMTIRKFEGLIRDSGMKVEFMGLFPVKGLPAVARIPFVRELLVRAASCILTRT